MTLAITLSIGIPLLILFIMLVFGLYSNRSLGWVFLCLIWGALGYFLTVQLISYLLAQGAENKALVVYFAPIVQQVLVSIGVFFVLYREKSDNLIEGAVFGWAVGLGFAILDSIYYIRTLPDIALDIVLARFFQLLWYTPQHLQSQV